MGNGDTKHGVCDGGRHVRSATGYFASEQSCKERKNCMRILKTLRTRGLALFVALSMCISLLPAPALAVSGTEDWGKKLTAEELWDLVAEQADETTGIATVTAHDLYHLAEKARAELVTVVYGGTVLAQIPGGEDVTLFVTEDGAKAEDSAAEPETTPEPEKESEAVQDFLDAVAELPAASTVTKSNAGTLRDQVNAAIDMAEVLADDLYFSDAVQGALNNTVYSLFQTVLDAEEIEDSKVNWNLQPDLYHSTVVIPGGA